MKDVTETVLSFQGIVRDHTTAVTEVMRDQVGAATDIAKEQAGKVKKVVEDQAAQTQRAALLYLREPPPRAEDEDSRVGAASRPPGERAGQPRHLADGLERGTG